MARFTLALLLLALASVEAFFVSSIAFRPRSLMLAAENKGESAFVPIEAEDESDETFEKVELLGKGAAKVRLTFSTALPSLHRLKTLINILCCPFAGKTRQKKRNLD